MDILKELFFQKYFIREILINNKEHKCKSKGNCGNNTVAGVFSSNTEPGFGNPYYSFRSLLIP